ncbi:hypothetical protein SLS53_000660 [Cytospora paraplurivora]|uniref:Uncharacterized protein n=1 Tax=Cytospora paraplurivora TaxID=2898453 RepID=A0AAN9YN96_9PEZI
MEQSSDAQYDGDSESSYKEHIKRKSPPPKTSTSSTPRYSLRDTSDQKRPSRYRKMDPSNDPNGFTQPRPPFNEELAKLVPWKTVPLDHPGPLPSEVAYEQLLAKRERKKNNPSDGKDEVPFKPFQEVQNGESPGPCVAHLSRRTLEKDPLRLDDPSIFDNTKFRPPSDEWNFRDQCNPEIPLDEFGDDDDQEMLELERRKAYYVDWTQLQNGVRWAVIHDLTQDYGFSGTIQLLSLTVDEVISFKTLYRSEKAKWDAYQARIAGEVQDAIKRAPNECTRPFPRAGPNAPPPAHAFEPVTSSLSKDEIKKGYRYLRFMGLNKYAANFDKWYGSGGAFFEIPEVLDLNLDFENPVYYRYPALPQPSGGTLHQAADIEQVVEQPFAGAPRSPGMPNPAHGVHWPPLIDYNYNPDAMDLASQAFRLPVDSNEASASQDARDGDYPLPDTKYADFVPVIFDPIDRIRAEVDEEFRRKMNPDRVIINGNAKEELGSGLEQAGYRYMTEADVLPMFEDEAGFLYAPDDKDFVPHFDLNVRNKDNDWSAKMFSEVMEENFLTDFALDVPTSNSNEVATNNAPQVPAVGASASKWGRRYNNPSPHENVDDSDPVLDAFLPEQDDPKDGDYEQRSKKRKRGSAQRKTAAGKAPPGSAAKAARAPRKPRQPRKKANPSEIASQHPQTANALPQFGKTVSPARTAYGAVSQQSSRPSAAEPVPGPTEKGD